MQFGMCTTRWLPSSNSPTFGEPRRPRMARRARRRKPEVCPVTVGIEGRPWACANSSKARRAVKPIPGSPNRGHAEHGGRCGQFSGGSTIAIVAMISVLSILNGHAAPFIATGAQGNSKVAGYRSPSLPGPRPSTSGQRLSLAGGSIPGFV